MKLEKRSHLTLAVVLAIALWEAKPAEGACIGVEGGAATAESRVELWVGSFDLFLKNNPDLTAEQGEVVARALSSTTLESFDESSPLTTLDTLANIEKLRTIVEHLEKSFSTDQLGELFSGFGDLQHWLVELAAAPAAYCNCAGLHQSCGSSYPPGATCQTGCLSWSRDGNDYVGICSAPAVH